MSDEKELFQKLIAAGSDGVWVAVLYGDGERFGLLTGMWGERREAWGNYWAPNAASPGRFAVSTDDIRLATADEINYIKLNGGAARLPT